MRPLMRSLVVFLWVGGFSTPFFLGACELQVVLPNQEISPRENGGREGVIVEADASESTTEATEEVRPETTPDIPRSCETCAARLSSPTCLALKVQASERLLLLKGSLLAIQDLNATSILDLSTCQRLPETYSPRSFVFDIGHHILILEDSAMAFENKQPTKLTLQEKGTPLSLTLAAGWRFNNTRSGLPPKGRGFLEFTNDEKKLLVVFYHSNVQTHQITTFDAPSGSFGIAPLARGKTHDLYRIIPEQSGSPAYWLTWNHQQGSLGRIVENQLRSQRLGHLIGQDHAFWFVTDTDAAGKPKLTIWRWPLATNQPGAQILLDTPYTEPHKPILDGDRLFLAFSTSATLFSPSEPPITFDTSSQPFPSDTRFLHFQGQEIFAFLPQEGLFLFRLENAAKRITKLPLLPPQSLPNQPLSVQYQDDVFWSPTAPNLPKRWLITQAIPESNRQRMWYASAPNRISEPFEGGFIAPAIMGRITEGWRFYANTLSYYSDNARVSEHSSLRLSDGKRFSHIAPTFLQRIGEPFSSERIEVIEERNEETPHQRFHIIDHQCYLTSPLTPVENSTQILASDTFLVTQSNLSASSVQFFAICQP